MDWDNLRFFHAVAQSGNLSIASRQLGVSQSTVHRRLHELETALGTKLFSRSQAGHSLTPAGEELAVHAGDIESLVHKLHHAVARQDYRLAGAVRVSTTQLAADYIVLPALPGFRERYPDICIELEAMPQIADLLGELPSIALRFQRPQQGDYTIRRLGALPCSLYASRAWARGRGTSGDGSSGEPANAEPGDSSASWSEHDYIGWSAPFSEIHMSRWLRRYFQRPCPALAVGSMQAHIEACRMGLGLANLPCFVAEGEPGLVRLLPVGGTMTLEAWLVIPRGIRSSARVEVVAEFLARAVVDTLDPG